MHSRAKVVLASQRQCRHKYERHLVGVLQQRVSSGSLIGKSLPDPWAPGFSQESDEWIPIVVPKPSISDPDLVVVRVKVPEY